MEGEVWRRSRLSSTRPGRREEALFTWAAGLTPVWRPRYSNGECLPRRKRRGYRPAVIFPHAAEARESRECNGSARASGVSRPSRVTDRVRTNGRLQAGSRYTFMPASIIKRARKA